MRLRGAGFKTIIVFGLLFLAVFFIVRYAREKAMLLKIIERLTAETRIAEVLVTQVKTDPRLNKTFTTIKFLEYDTQNNPLGPRYFTFSGNIIQFQSLVIRFDDFYVKSGDPLKGKSAYIFLKAFAFIHPGVEEFEITRVNEIPSGYAVTGSTSDFEKKLWKKFWKYAFEPHQAKRAGVKNAQIEAPGIKFLPGLLYTIKIEHDGGMRIDARNLPDILKGEKIDF
ncbi:MAG: hypothetical protein WDL87_04305 [Candidatus Omnitrophota bacterium]|jgi:hypothetical protein